jgi:flavin-dependent dehydrogenase
MQDKLEQADVTVIGGGLAGMAVSFHLAKAGMHVLCIEPEPGFNQVVGESLDWSAPDLLRALGLPMERLIAEGIATYKRHVTLKLGDGCNQQYVPGEWLGRPPYNMELHTLHVDRVRLNEAIRKTVLGLGVNLIHDKVVAVEKNGSSVANVTTANDVRIVSPWFVDASGSAASLLPRAFDLPAFEYGPKKVAMWTYFSVPELTEGTTLYAAGIEPPYMEWVWEIPIRTDCISVGYVALGDTIKAQRQRGLSVEEIFCAQLSRFPRFVPLLQQAGNLSAHVTSYSCSVRSGVSGPNWIVVGEAAAMVDPMTANGVTAALRHAAEASKLIIRSRNRTRLPRLAAAMYNRRVTYLARFFNSGIENVIYDWPIRNRIGVLNAGDVYTIPAWSLNAVYSRMRPSGAVSTLLFGFLLGVFRACGSLFNSYCRRTAPAREVAV